MTIAVASPPAARERIIEAAYGLFSTRGVRGVGIDEIIERSRVAKATLYRHFASKDDLVLAVLQRREERWLVGFVEAEARRRGATPHERLLAIFDVLDEFFHSDEFDGSAFVEVLLEMGPAHPLGEACIEHLRTKRKIIAKLAAEAGLVDPDELAHSLQLLMEGSIVAAIGGDDHAAARAKAMAAQLIDARRPR